MKPGKPKAENQERINGTKFRVAYRIPRELRGSLIKLLRRVNHLIPEWCNHINVDYSSELDESEAENRGAAASMLPVEHYKHGLLLISPPFFDQDEASRLETLAHEIFHLPFARLWSITSDAIDALQASDEAKEVLKEEARRAWESGVQDCALIITENYEL